MSWVDYASALVIMAAAIMSPSSESKPLQKRHSVVPFVPFPGIMDDFSLVSYFDNLMVSGSQFTNVEPDGRCVTCGFMEEAELHCCEVEPTVCQNITLRECLPSEANFTCTVFDYTNPNITEGPEFALESPYPGISSPLCHIRFGELRLRPSYASQLYLLSPIRSCNFQIAPPPTPTTHPNATAAPAVEHVEHEGPHSLCPVLN